MKVKSGKGNGEQGHMGNVFFGFPRNDYKLTFCSSSSSLTEQEEVPRIGWR